MLKVIDISALQPGMYVTQVTQQQGEYRVASTGRVQTQTQINDLKKKGILQLEIDLSRSLLGDAEPHSTEPEPLDTPNHAGLSYRQQLEHSLKLYEQAKTVHGQLMNRIAKGKVANLEEVNQISQQLVDKIFECEDAIGIVTMLNENDQYFMEHSINCAILIILFSRFVGLPDETTVQLGAGALLMDIGMVKLPLLITEKPESFNQADCDKMHKHVDTALDMVAKVEQVSEVSKEVIALHHERLDGSGYPQGLTEHNISQHGRMVAIVDVYDALTTSRPHRNAYSPAEALRFMSEELSGLDQTLLGQFIMCIGANPVGSVVKLASNKLAVVMRLNKNNPLNPVVMAFFDLTSKAPIVKQIDLAKHDDAIVGTVDYDESGLNLAQFLRQNLLSR